MGSNLPPFTHSIFGWIALALVSMPGPAPAEDWPFFRGPDNNGVSIESGWLTEWPPSGPEIAWRAEIGIGVSSFVVVGHRVLTMGNRNNSDVVWCWDVDSGQVLWKFSYACAFEDRNFEGGTASTPTVEGGFVYTLSYDGQVYGLNLEDGRLQWSRNLVKDFGGRLSSWKYAGSPLVVSNLVIFDTGAEGMSTVALHKLSGKVVWSTGDDLPGYATPIPFAHAEERGVLVFKARAMVAHDLRSGEELWRLGWKTYYDVNASTPTVVGDKLFISTGYGGRSARGALFQLGQNPPRQLWLNDDIETKMNSAVVFENHVYCVSERSGGQLMCVDLRTGTTVWTDSSFARYGTLMIAGGKLIILDEKGELVIADAVPDGYHERARARILAGRCWAMPVLANGRIFARNNKGDMVCLDVRPMPGR
jgi:outer membrane protein assembly factor BamB